MKKKKTIYLISFLIACLLFSAAPLAGFPALSLSSGAAAIVESGVSGENLTWTLDADGKLTISGTGEMQGHWGDFSFPARERITAVVIENGVTNVGFQAFRDHPNLASVSIPDSVTTIEDHAFFGCMKLVSVSLPDSITSIGMNAFRDCASLTSITIPHGVTAIRLGTFYGCTALRAITIPDSVTSIETMALAYCAGLESLTVQAGNPVYRSEGNCIIKKETGALVAGCKNSVIPKDGSITAIGDYAFAGSTGPASITLPDGVTTVGPSAFRDCTGLTAVIIPNSVTEIKDQAFNGCTRLSSLTIPNSVTKIGYLALGGCAELETLAVQADNPVYRSEGNCIIKKETGEVFAGCRGSRIPTDAGVTSIGEQAFGSCTGLETFTIPDNITVIGDYAFYKCAGLTAVTIPNSVTVIGSYAFYDCAALQSVTIPGSVTKIGYLAFGGCAGLETLAVQADNPVYRSEENCIIVKETGELTAGCKESRIPTDGSVTSIGASAFNCCTKLSTITIPDSVTAMGQGVFIGCTGLISVVIPPTVTQIEMDAVPEDTILYGTPGSYAQTWAEQHRIVFRSVDEAPPGYIPGDVDANGRLEAADARLTLRAAVGLEDYAAGSDRFLLADTDANGKLEAGDARSILRAAVGLEKPAQWHVG